MKKTLSEKTNVPPKRTLIVGKYHFAEYSPNPDCGQNWNIYSTKDAARPGDSNVLFSCSNEADTETLLTLFDSVREAEQTRFEAAHAKAQAVIGKGFTS